MFGDFTEAAVRSGHRDEALALARELEPLGTPAAITMVRPPDALRPPASGRPTTKPGPPSRTR